MEKERDTTQDFYELSVNEVMDKRLPLIEKDASLDCVLSILTESDHVWIVESKGSKKLVGIITEHDILDICSPRKKNHTLDCQIKSLCTLKLLKKRGTSCPEIQ